MENKPNIYKKAVNHSAIYGAADILRRLVGFLMLPIYTRYLTPEDYGIVQMLLIAISLMEVFLGMRMGQAIFRYYYLEKDMDAKKTVMSTAFIITFCASVAAYLILNLNAGLASSVLFGKLDYKNLMQIYALMLIVAPMEDYGLIYVRIHQRPVLFLVLSLFKLAAQLVLNIYLLVVLKLGVLGIVYSAVISSLAMSIFSLLYAYRHSGIKFSKTIAKQMMFFSFPLWISGAAYLYTGSADKYFLRLFSGLGDVGLYSLAAKFGILIVVVVWAPFSNMWQAMRYEVYEMPDAKEIYKKIFILLVLVLSTAGLGISLFSGVAIRIMADKAFWPASAAVPILVVSFIAMALSYFNNFGIFLKEKTGIIAIGTYLNAIVMTIALIVFIKFYGFIGAAIASVIGSFFNLYWIESRSRRLYDMELPWGRAALMFITMELCYALSFVLPREMLPNILGKVAIVFLFLALLFILPVFRADEKKQIKTYSLLIANKFARVFVNLVKPQRG